MRSTPASTSSTADTRRTSSAPGTRPDPARGRRRTASWPASAPGQELIRIRDAAGEPAGGLDHHGRHALPRRVRARGGATGRGEARRIIHPIVVVERTRTASCAPPAGRRPDGRAGGNIAESWIHVDLGRRVPAGLEADVTEVLHDVREVVRDAPAMARQARALADRLLADACSTPTARRSRRRRTGRKTSRTCSLARRRHFTFLGHRYLTGRCRRLDWPEGPGLGVVRRESSGVADALTPEQPTPRASFSCSPAPARRAACSAPCSPTTSPSASSTPGTAPGRAPLPRHAHRRRALRERARYPGRRAARRGAIHRAGFPLASYSGQQMLEVISALPREELFSSTQQQLHDRGRVCWPSPARRTVRVFLRPTRTPGCLLPGVRAADRYTTSSRIAMADVLPPTCRARPSTSPSGSPSPRSRSCTSRCTPTPTSPTEAVDVDDLQTSSPSRSATGTTACCP